MRTKFIGMALATCMPALAAAATGTPTPTNGSSIYFFEGSSLVGQHMTSCDGSSRQWGKVSRSGTQDVVAVYGCTGNEASRIEFGPETDPWVRSNFCAIFNACAFGPVIAPSSAAADAHD